MAKVSSEINSFTAGELSPRLRTRTNLKIYNKGCTELKNIIIEPQGGVRKRAGTEFIAEAGGS